MRTYQLYRAILLAAEPSRGVFWDEYDTSGFSQNYLSVEYPIANTAGNGGPYTNGLHDFLTDSQGLLTIMSASLTPKEVWVNCASYYNFVDDEKNVQSAGFGQFELTLRADNTNDIGVLNSYKAYNTLPKACGYEGVGVWQWTDRVNGYTTSGSSGTYN